MAANNTAQRVVPKHFKDDRYLIVIKSPRKSGEGRKNLRKAHQRLRLYAAMIDGSHADALDKALEVAIKIKLEEGLDA